MPQLTNEEIRELRRRIAAEFSGLCEAGEEEWAMPFTKPQGVQLLGVVLMELEAAATATVQAIPAAHPARQWLINHQRVLWRILELACRAEREVS